MNNNMLLSSPDLWVQYMSLPSPNPGQSTSIPVLTTRSFLFLTRITPAQIFTELLQFFILSYLLQSE